MLKYYSCLQKLGNFNEVNFVESSQLRKISIIGISILCLSPIEFFSNQLFEEKKEEEHVVISTNEMKLQPNNLSNNYEIFNPNIKATSEDIEKLVSENKEKEITEIENKLESEKARKQKEAEEEAKRKKEEEERLARLYEETQTSTSNQNVYEYNQANNKVQEPVYTPAPAPNTDVATSLVNFALQFVGYSYRSGGTDLYNGVDCSGFTMKVYEQFGYSLPHNAASQSSYGSYVSLDQLAPGDLIFYGYGGSICHVAIYIGNGQIVHAATSSQGIVTAGYQIMPIITARRILN